MLSSGIFPTQLKFAEVKPIFQKGDKNVTSNYRPISLLTSFSKIFEKVIHKEFFTILIIITSSLMNNLVSGMHHQQTLCPII